MGLDISPGGAHWSYSGFHVFRKNLAAEEGFVLDEMVGFGGSRSWDTVSTTLEDLLNHSDCEGYLDGWQCEEMVERLTAIKALWEERRANSGVENWYIESLGALIDGMGHCAQHRCAMSFH